MIMINIIMIYISNSFNMFKNCFLLKVFYYILNKILIIFNI